MKIVRYLVVGGVVALVNLGFLTVAVKVLGLIFSLSRSYVLCLRLP